jgi:hypothetical protein
MVVFLVRYPAAGGPHSLAAGVAVHITRFRASESRGAGQQASCGVWPCVCFNLSVVSRVEERGAEIVGCGGRDDDDRDVERQ